MDYASLSENQARHHLHQYVRAGPYRTARELRQLRPDAAGAERLHALMAEPSGEPAGYGYSYADMAGGYTGALAALIALWHRRRTGRGQFIDLSQFEALVSVVGPALLDIAVNGRDAEAAGIVRRKLRRRRTASIDAARSATTTIDGSRSRCARRRNGSGSSRRSARRRGPRTQSSARFTCGCEIAPNSTRTSRDGPRTQRRRRDDDAAARRNRRRRGAQRRRHLPRDPQLKERGFLAPVKRPDGQFHAVTGIPIGCRRPRARFAPSRPMSARTTTTCWANCWGSGAPNARN